MILVHRFLATRASIVVTALAKEIDSLTVPKTWKGAIPSAKTKEKKFLLTNSTLLRCFNKFSLIKVVVASGVYENMRVISVNKSRKIDKRRLRWFYWLCSGDNHHRSMSSLLRNLDRPKSRVQIDHIYYKWLMYGYPMYLLVGMMDTVCQ